jgi:hypothetical protein
MKVLRTTNLFTYGYVWPNIYIYIINMPCGNFYCAMCHNFGPSLIIIMDDGDQYFERK